jgi:Ni/Fe-hydrogenase subunit HybB-like protein
MTLKQRLFPLSPFGLWVLFLLVVLAAALVAALVVLIKGLGVTNLTNLVPWGLWIGIDLSSIALSAGAFVLSAAVYLFKLKKYEPLARTAVFVGMVGYSMALMTLFIDIGRPDRFWHGWFYWNLHSPLWEVTMCVTIYFNVLMLEVAPIIGQADWFKSRWPNLSHRLEHVHKLAPYLAVLGLCLSTLHQSSLGATYGILRARPIWYRPSLAFLFYASAIVAGPALTVLASKIAAYVTPQAKVRREILDPVTRVIGWGLLIYFGLRVWDLLVVSNSSAPGRDEGLVLLTQGSLAFNFWVLEFGLGMIVPIIILLNNRLRRQDRLTMLALTLIVVGLIAYRWDTNMVGQLVAFAYQPQLAVPLYTSYTPSLAEWLVGLGVVAYGVLAFTLAVRYLNLVNHEMEPEPVVVKQVAAAPATA